jgi:hypothetical protein
MIAAYYKMVVLSDEIKAINKIRSKARLDCIQYTDLLHSKYDGLTNFVNSKGQFFLYKTPCRDFVNTDSKRLAEWSLTNGINLSSIYIEDMDCPEFGYGYPNSNRCLFNGATNPMFKYRNDGYLFIINKDYTQIEILVIIDGRNLISSYYQKLIDGGLDEELKSLREKSRPFYLYDGLPYSKLFSMT